MLARVTVPILPYRRRDFRANDWSGATVTVYDVPYSGASLTAYGIPIGTPTAAILFRDRNATVVLPNPVTLDGLGGPDDLFQVGEGVSLSFYALPGIYDLLVVMTDGRRFGILGVHVRHAPGDRHIMYFKDCCIGSLGAGLQVFAKAGAGEPDPTFNPGDQNAISCAPAAAVTNFYAWAGPTPTTTSPFITDNVEAQADASAYPIVMETIITEADALGQNANQYTGFGFGWYNAAALPASPSDAGLCILYARWSAPLQWELVIAKGDGTAFEKTVLTSVPPPKVGKAFKLRLILIPGVQARAYVSGVLGATSTNAAKLPDPFAVGFGGNSLSVLLPSIFHQGGNNAAADLVTQWYDTKVEVFGKP